MPTLRGIRGGGISVEDSVTDARPPVDDLFGDDDLNLPPTPGAPARRAQRGGGLLWVAVTLVVVALAAVFWYLSGRQHERYFLGVDADRTVRVNRGLFFPFGSADWRPNRAYAPFELPIGIEPARVGEMSVVELDQTLFALLIAVAERELYDVRVGQPDLAEDMLLRARKLNTITRVEDKHLLRMHGDVAFRRGLAEIHGIQTRFDEAINQFEMAAMSGGSMFKGAPRWVTTIARLRDEFRTLSLDSGLDPDEILPIPPPAPPVVPVIAAEPIINDEIDAAVPPEPADAGAPDSGP